MHLMLTAVVRSVLVACLQFFVVVSVQFDILLFLHIEMQREIIPLLLEKI